MLGSYRVINMSNMRPKSDKIPYSGVLMPSYNKAFANPSLHESILLKDNIRNAKFKEAIYNTVKEGNVVIDVGTGTGILALLAVEAGAHTVYAVEQNKDVLDKARRIAVEKKMADKIQFIQADFMTLPQEAIPHKADVVISETIGEIGINEGILPLALKAKKFMKPDGKFIPQNISLFIVPVRMDKELEKHIRPSCLDNVPVIKVKLNHLSSTQKAKIKYLADPKKLLNIDLVNVDSADTKSQVQFKSLTKASLYGLYGWFETLLDDHTLLSNSPLSPDVSWAQYMLKLPTQLQLQEKDTLTVKLKSTSTPRYTLLIFDLSLKGEKNNRITALYQH